MTTPRLDVDRLVDGVIAVIEKTVRTRVEMLEQELEQLRADVTELQAAAAAVSAPSGRPH